VSALDDLARILAERELDVGDLIRQAEEGARADVAETLRRLLADDLLRRVEARLGGRPLVALAGVADGLRPLVLELAPGDLDNEARLERLVREHNELLLGALEDGAVVPFRFGTTFPERAALDEWLLDGRPGPRGILGRGRRPAAPRRTDPCLTPSVERSGLPTLVQPADTNNRANGPSWFSPSTPSTQGRRTW